MTIRYDIYGIGNALVDLEYRVEDDFLRQHGIAKGMMTLAEADAQARLLTSLEQAHPRMKQASGGSAANSVIAAAAFGASTFYSCKVAADALGDFYRADLIAAGVATNLAEQRPVGTSGTCVVMVTPDGERTMNTFLGITADVSQAELDLDALAASRWLYIEGYLCTSDSARLAVAEAVRTARAAGTQVALTFSDPAMVQFFKPQLTELLGDGVDLLFCNEAEALGYTGATDLDQALAILRQHARQGVITRGGAGAWAWTAHAVIEVPPQPTTVLDTVGAGDSVAGAVLYGLARGWTLGDSARLAMRIAAEIVAQYGPRLPLQRYRELLAEAQA